MRLDISAAAFLFVLSSLSFSVLAQASNETSIDFARIRDVQIPGDIGSMIGDARVNVYDYGHRELGGIVVVNGTVTEASGRLVDGPTHNVYVKDAATLQSIFDSPSMLKEFNRQRSVHNLSIEALDFGGQVKLAIGTIVASILSLFIPPE